MSFKGAAKLRDEELPRPAPRLISLSLILLCALTAPGRAHAQTPTPTPDGEVIRVETNLVAVPVIVTDKRGRRVHGLNAHDFDVREEGRSVEISYFAAGADRVSLLFLLDASGSTRDLIAQQTEAALALFSRFGQRSRISLIHFQEKPEFTLPFTTAAESARAVFRGVARPDHRTAIFDAALAAVRSFGKSGAGNIERRIVILISDGLDTASATRPIDVINAAAQADVTFYVIHTPLFTPRDGRLRPREPSKGFRDLAEKTGGQFFVVGSVEAALSPRPIYDLGPIFQAIEDDLRGQYILGYYADQGETTGNTRRVEVQLKPQAGRKLRVRHFRKDYTLKGRQT